MIRMRSLYTLIPNIVDYVEERLLQRPRRSQDAATPVKKSGKLMPKSRGLSARVRISSSAKERVMARVSMPSVGKVAVSKVTFE